MNNDGVPMRGLLQLLTATQIAEILHISKSFAYRLMQTGKIRTVKIEGARRVRKVDLEEYIDANIDPPMFG